MTEALAKNHKASYIGAPAVFKLELVCQTLHTAFGDGSFGIYLVGSALERQDWRDVDIRMILSDEAFQALFSNVRLDLEHAAWEFDPRWLLLTACISDWVSKHTGLPIDFQFQPQTLANKFHKGRRNALGIRIAPTSLREEQS